MIGDLVCEGCGGKLEPIKTVNNANEPTYWVGCNYCSCFRGGVEKKYFEIARYLVENNEIVPYSHMHKSEYDISPEKYEYWLNTQTSSLSHKIRHIEVLLEKRNSKKLIC